MASFTYKAKKPNGEIQKGTLNAQGEADAVAELRRQGLIVISVSSGKGSKGGKGGGAAAAKKKPGEKQSFWSLELTKSEPKLKVKTQEMVVFSRQLSTMVASGIPLVEAVEILAEQTTNAGPGDAGRGTVGKGLIDGMRDERSDVLRRIADRERFPVANTYARAVDENTIAVESTVNRAQHGFVAVHGRGDKLGHAAHHQPDMAFEQGHLAACCHGDEVAVLKTAFEQVALWRRYVAVGAGNHGQGLRTTRRMYEATPAPGAKARRSFA